MAKTIVIIATLDTRGDEVGFLRRLIEKRGHDVITVDAGVMGRPSTHADFTREEVAEAGGRHLKELVEAAEKGADRYDATRVMIEGVKRVVGHLYSRERLDGIMSLGGSTGATLGAAAMKTLPMGVPKLVLTTLLDPATVGDADIAVVQSPVDLVGLNRIVQKALSNAAGAIVGMVEQELPETEQKTLVGITALGVTTPAVRNVISRLEKRGCDSLVFHAKTAELDRLVEAGAVDAIIDLTSFETVPMTLYSDEMISLLTGVPEVRRTRLESANQRGLPQIIAPGGLDMHIFRGTGIRSVPAEYRERRWTMHGENVVLIRTSANELEEVAKSIARRANEAAGPVVIILPLRGFSEASRAGAPLCEPEADRAFIRVLEDHLEERVEITAIDCHINDDDFADEVARAFDAITSARG